MLSSRAASLRIKYNLSFFDSFHAATAMSLLDSAIISFDQIYDLVEGLNRIDPREWSLEDS